MDKESASALFERKPTFRESSATLAEKRPGRNQNKRLSFAPFSVIREKNATFNRFASACACPSPGFHVSKREKALMRLLSGKADRDFRFDELTMILGWLGFSRRVRGDHHIMTHASIPEIINIQPVGGSAKPYQVKQVRDIVSKYWKGGLDV
jgi:hypothetical protein